MKRSVMVLLIGLLASAVQAEVGTVKVTFSEAEGIGAEEGVMRRDPSDVIKVGELYYVWYSKGKISPGYDATVWYATSTDGHRWTEKGMALPKGKAGGWGRSQCPLHPIFLLLRIATGYSLPARPGSSARASVLIQRSVSRSRIHPMVPGSASRPIRR